MAQAVNQATVHGIVHGVGHSTLHSFAPQTIGGRIGNGTEKVFRGFAFAQSVSVLKQRKGVFCAKAFVPLMPWMRLYGRGVVPSNCNKMVTPRSVVMRVWLACPNKLSRPAAIPVTEERRTMRSPR